jgi:hypothetical protein
MPLAAAQLRLNHPNRFGSLSRLWRVGPALSGYRRHDLLASAGCCSILLSIDFKPVPADKLVASSWIKNGRGSLEIPFL